MKNNIFKTKSFWLSVVLCLIPFVLSAVFYDKMPDMVATHFGFDNQPDNYSPKWIAAFLIPLIMLAANVVTWFAINAEPKRQGINKHIKRVILWMVPILSVIVQCIIIMYSVSGVNLVSFVPLMIGVLFMVMGNYLPKCRHNYTMGIKLPWTLASEENWNKTHRMAGRVWIIGGIVITLYTFFNMHYILFLAVITMMVIIPAVYSYILYKQEL